jgi:hypothetical protein
MILDYKLLILKRITQPGVHTALSGLDVFNPPSLRKLLLGLEIPATRHVPGRSRQSLPL